MDIVFHYPPELMSLLIDTIPLLFRSKMDVLLFFKGAGVNDSRVHELSNHVRQDRTRITEYEICRTVLAHLNEKGEFTIRERREILKRVTEFEDFSTCWPNDQLKAKGLVAEIRRVVDVKDSFTRINQEREKEKKKHQADQQEKFALLQKKRMFLSEVKSDLYSLFGESNSWSRGKKLEGILNRLFQVGGILIREAFTLKGQDSEGIVEQIDGVVEIEGHLYLVEMKWWNKPLGRGDVSQHLVRIFSRGDARGIFISSSGYTDPAIDTCKEALQHTVIVLCKLEEVIFLLENDVDLKDFLKTKIHVAIIDKNPMFEPLREALYNDC